MKRRYSSRGFGIIEAEKYQNERGEFTRLVQESSAVGEYEDSLSNPGGSYLWIGQDHHLNREEVEEFIKILQYWKEHKRLPIPVELENS